MESLHKIGLIFIVALAAIWARNHFSFIQSITG